MAKGQIKDLRANRIVITQEVIPEMVAIPKTEYDLLLEIKNTFLGGKNEQTDEEETRS